MHGQRAVVKGNMGAGMVLAPVPKREKTNVEGYTSSENCRSYFGRHCGGCSGSTPNDRDCSGASPGSDSGGDLHRIHFRLSGDRGSGQEGTTKLTDQEIGEYVRKRLAEGYSVTLYPQASGKMFTVATCHPTRP